MKSDHGWVNSPEKEYSGLSEFLQRLRSAKIHFSLASHREDVVMVQIAVPGERWEVEFLADGSVDGRAVQERRHYFAAWGD
jgi:hypothetical protein